MIARASSPTARGWPGWLRRRPGPLKDRQGWPTSHWGRSSIPARSRGSGFWTNPINQLHLQIAVMFAGEPSVPLCCSLPGANFRAGRGD